MANRVMARTQVFEYADEVAAEMKQSLLNLEKTNASLSGSVAGSVDLEDA